MKNRHQCQGGYDLPSDGGPCKMCGARQSENCGRPKADPLTTAAPKMLAALKAIRSVRVGYSGISEISYAEALADAAIDEAEGRS